MFAARAAAVVLISSCSPRQWRATADAPAIDHRCNMLIPPDESLNLLGAVLRSIVDTGELRPYGHSHG